MFTSADPDEEARFPCPPRYDFWGTLRFIRMGRNDPSVHREASRLCLARHFRDQAATLELIAEGHSVLARAWGPGSVAAFEELPDLLGLHDAIPELGGHSVVHRLSRKHRGLPLSRRGDLTLGLVQTILQQLVSWSDAAAAYRKLTQLAGAPAPGPFTLLLPPPRDWLARLPLHQYAACDIPARRAKTIVEVARLGDRPVRWARQDPAEFRRRLQTIPGVGPWTVDHCLGFHFGEADALPLGDFGFPHLVSWALEKKPRSDDREMAELMAPFAGQRFRVLRWIMASDFSAPRYGPRGESSAPSRRPRRSRRG